MANLKDTKTIFAFTSPRTIEKIIPEIDLLIKRYSGWEWNKDTQELFFKDLFESEFYEWKSLPKDLAFAARDRITRAPKALWFVDLKPTIQLTEAWKKLLSWIRVNETITKQLLKFQLPSPYHRVSDDKWFNVRPYLELLRFVHVLWNPSKTEIAMFFVQMINYNKFDEIVEKVKDYRLRYSEYRWNKKEFIYSEFSKQICNTYKDEIEAWNFKWREDNDSSLSEFIERKISNSTDYADALIRYIRATKLVTLDKNTRLIVSQFNKDKVDYILSNIDRNAINFTSEKEFKKYLFNTSNIILLDDDINYLKEKLEKIWEYKIENLNIEEIKNLLDKEEKSYVNKIIEAEEIQLKTYSDYDDIQAVYTKIKKKEVFDPPLYFEWNTRRSMVMIDHAMSIQWNFKVDLEWNPLSTALWNVPDIEIEYDDFKLMVEVTMSSWQKQFDMEWEPVPRHFGNFKKTTNKPVYCLFIAPNISEWALAHFFALNKSAPKFYWSQTSIIPMNLDMFKIFIKTAKDNKIADPNLIKQYFDWILQINRSSNDEVLRLNYIENTIDKRIK